MALDWVAGLWELSRPGTAICPTITIPTPASTAALNGRSSLRSRLSRLPGIIGRLVWLSVAVLPWPG